MSLLVYSHKADEIAIYTDTLATILEGEPLAFCDKAFVVAPQHGICDDRNIADGVTVVRLSEWSSLC